MKEKEFYDIVKQYEKLVFSYCLSFVKDYQEAENLMQDTFFSFYKSVDHLKSDNYKAYIMKIAANKCKDFLKSAFKRKVIMTEDEYFTSIENSDNTSDEVLRKEEYEIIKKSIEKLKEPYRDIATEFYINQKTIDLITQEKNIPKKTVQTQLYRARDKLKYILKEELI